MILTLPQMKLLTDALRSAGIERPASLTIEMSMTSVLRLDDKDFWDKLSTAESERAAQLLLAEMFIQRMRSHTPESAAEEMGVPNFSETSVLDAKTGFTVEDLIDQAEEDGIEISESHREIGRWDWVHEDSGERSDTHMPFYTRLEAALEAYSHIGGAEVLAEAIRDGIEFKRQQLADQPRGEAPRG